MILVCIYHLEALFREAGESLGGWSRHHGRQTFGGYSPTAHSSLILCFLNHCDVRSHWVLHAALAVDDTMLSLL